VTIEEVIALAGPATPHFALQIRDRIRNLVESLPAAHPARIEGETQIARLEELAQHSGDPRGPGPLPEDLAAESPADAQAREEGSA
jgi:hypothetical protein